MPTEEQEEELKKKKKKKDEAEGEEAAPISIFEEPQTYVYVRIRLTPAISPLVEGIYPTIAQIVPSEEQSEFLSKPPSKEDLSSDFKSALYRSLDAIAIDYTTFIGKEMGGQ